MKSLFTIAAIAIGLSASAQKLKETEVPQAVKNAFVAKYPKTEGKWEKEKSNYEVNFKSEGKKMSCVIDPSGSIVETESDISPADLPVAVQQYIKMNYPGAKIKEASEIVKSDGTKNYEAEVNGKDVMFDSDGKPLK